MILDLLMKERMVMGIERAVAKVPCEKVMGL